MQGYGSFILVMSILGMGGLLELGLSQAAVKYFNPSKNSSASELSTIWFLFGLLSGIAFLICFVCWLLFINILGWQNFSLTQTSLVGLAISLKIINQLYNANLLAFERFHEVNLVNFVGFCVRQIGSVGLLALGIFEFGTILPLIVFLGSATSLAISWFFYNRYKLLNFKFGIINWAYCKKIIKDSLSLFLIQLGGEASLHGDKFIIFYIVGSAELAAYNIAYIIIARVNDISYLLASIYFPEMCKLVNTKGFKKLRTLNIKILIVTYSLTGFAFAMYFIFGGYLLASWLDSVPDGSFETGQILIIGALIGSGSWSLSNALIAMNCEFKLSMISLINTIISLILCAILTTYFGSVGAAISWALTYSFLAIFIVVFYIRVVRENDIT